MHALQPHVLVVDDDPLMRGLIADYLLDSAFRVSTAGSGAEMQKVLRDQVIDLVLLDLRLPGEDGMELAQRLRQDSDVPLIIVSGRCDMVDQVMGLEIAADDYVTKPFSNRELLARSRAVLRRYQRRPADDVPSGRGARRRAYRFAGWELNAFARKLTSPEGEDIGLSNGEFNLLLAFCEAPRRVLSRDRLIDLSRLHGDEIFDRSVDVQVFRLRRRIGGEDPAHALIRTERGVGYVFATDVEVVG